MKIFNETLSEYFGYFIVAFLAFFIAQTFVIQFNLTGIIYTTLYLALYFLIYALCTNILKFSSLVAFYSFYKLAILIVLPVSWLNITYSVKFIKIMNILSSKNDLNKLIKYFDDTDNKIQLTSLWLCAEYYDKNLAIKWFENNYISKNLPVDTYFYPLFKSLTTVDNNN